MMYTMCSHRSSIMSRRWALGVGQWALLAALAAGAGGCAKARAETVPDGPPLAMPQPPSRVFAPLEEEPLVSSPVPEAPVATPKNPAPAPPPRRAAAAPEPDRPAPAPTPAAEAPRELRAASSPADPEAERRITEIIGTAKRDLNRVDYRGLTRGGREQYDNAKGFIDEAEKALVARNFIYAQTTADKAAKIAQELLGR
jgi:hypothetical protein